MISALFLRGGKNRARGARLVAWLFLCGVVSFVPPSMAATLNFGWLARGYEFGEGSQAFEGRGIEIYGEGIPRVVNYPAGSAAKVLRHEPAPGSEFGSTAQDLELIFPGRTARQVQVTVGLDRRAPLPVVASLRAYFEHVPVATTTLNLGVDPASEMRSLEVSSSLGAIDRVVLSYGYEGCESAGGAMEPEVIGSVVFSLWSGARPTLYALLGGDPAAPRIRVVRPGEGATLTDRTIAGYVETDLELESVRAETHAGGDPVYLPFELLRGEDEGLTCSFAGMVPMSPGPNEIRIRAYAAGIRSDPVVVHFTYNPPAVSEPPREWPADLDIVAGGMEVTQAIQSRRMIEESDPSTWHGVDLSAPATCELVEGKPTMVRVYARALGTMEPIPDVPCILRGYRDGVELPESPLRADSSVQLVPGESYVEQRADPAKSFNFLLPPEWVRASGALSLTATVNAWQHIPERIGSYNALNNSGVHVAIHATDTPLHLYLYPISCRARGVPAPDAFAIALDMMMLRSVYPIDPAQLRVHIVPGWNWSPNYSTDDLYDLFYDFEDHLGWSCGGNGSIDSAPRPGIHELYVGLFSRDLFAGGLAVNEYYGDRTMCMASVSPWPYVSHEAGHRVGLRHIHTSCGEPGPYHSYPTYWDPLGSAYSAGSIGEWGMFVATDSMRSYLSALLALAPAWPAPLAEMVENIAGLSTHPPDPSSANDFMTYCGNRWISPCTWERLFGKFQRAAAETPASTDVERSGLQSESSASETGRTDALLIVGRVQAGAPALLKPAWRLPFKVSNAFDTGKGSHRLEMLDAKGGVIFRRYFEPTRLEADGEGPDQKTLAEWTFAERMPVLPGVARVRLLNASGKEIASRSAGVRSPSIKIDAATGPATWPGEGQRTVRWAAWDPDGDPLTYRVLYSCDKGQTWCPLAGGLTKPELALDLAALPGGRESCLLKVVATDGLHQGEATSSAGFTKIGQPPTVQILSDRVVTAPFSSVVLFESLVDDLEDKLLPAKQITWISSRDGVFGSGVVAGTSKFSKGFHRITCYALDRHGMMHGDTVGLYIIGEGGDSAWMTKGP